MSLVNVTNVVVLDNPTQFTNPFQFEITFECIQDLSDDLEWKMIYVGSSESSDYDQILEEVLVGPVTAGCHKFVLQADAPDVSKLHDGILGVTVVLITCSYHDHEFVRIGYYINNNEPGNETEEERLLMNSDDEDDEDRNMFETSRQHIDLSRVTRTILADKPRVTRFSIAWDEKRNIDEMVLFQSSIHLPFQNMPTGTATDDRHSVSPI
mmetsp:Transcript_31052/g.35374  ORF Transcript_31052/g.35374 Transcript_31052/m.35374 type:complete len:210 (+) Transcript_31052:128-757(+)|eukprot:CAMPEP_0194148490 /NCGR_PEP_ID=MMETSP0152-20130528/32776_1 /TAXON_ID=1049557 /ORGANISM="Thalassiothrix antarctica, Strain L6-D1" /LENGTH=209 /DNA_ID=CAMNT_0038850077 /DNA_START=91 /DNA_END=720 /DNA_ORIENTATION=-